MVTAHQNPQPCQLRGRSEPPSQAFVVSVAVVTALPGLKRAPTGHREHPFSSGDGDPQDHAQLLKKGDAAAPDLVRGSPSVWTRLTQVTAVRGRPQSHVALLTSGDAPSLNPAVPKWWTRTSGPARGGAEDSGRKTSVTTTAERSPGSGAACSASSPVMAGPPQR